MYRRNHEEVSIKARRSSDEVHMAIGDKLEATGEKAMGKKAKGERLEVRGE